MKNKKTINFGLNVYNHERKRINILEFYSLVFRLLDHFYIVYAKKKSGMHLTQMHPFKFWRIIFFQALPKMMLMSAVTSSTSMFASAFTLPDSVFSIIPRIMLMSEVTSSTSTLPSPFTSPVTTG